MKEGKKGVRSHGNSLRGRADAIEWRMEGGKG
jgi:hypothetical protein